MKKISSGMKFRIIILLIIGAGLFVIGRMHLYREPFQNKGKEIIQDKEEEPAAAAQGAKVESKAAAFKERVIKESAGLDKEIEALINKLKSGDIQISREAADKLVNLGKPAVGGLLDALAGADVALKGQIIFILGRIRDRDATPKLIEMLGDENAYIRRNAAEALGKIRDERALSSLGAALFDDDAGVRQRSAWALGELQDNKGVFALLDRMRDEKEYSVKAAVVNAFGRIKDQTATPILLSELKSVSDQLYKNAVVNSLGEIADSRAIIDLAEYLKQLKQYEPKEAMVKFQLDEAIKTAEGALEKIKNKQ